MAKPGPTDQNKGNANPSNPKAKTVATIKGSLKPPTK